MIDKRWIHNPELTPDQLQITQELTEELKINSSLATLLVQRGVSNLKNQDCFSALIFLIYTILI